MTKSMRMLLVGASLTGLVAGTSALASTGGIQGTCGGTHGKTDKQADSGKKATKSKREKHACQGQNTCKGKGGCGTTKSKNDCRGKGECRTDGKPMPKE